MLHPHQLQNPAESVMAAELAIEPVIDLLFLLDIF